MLSYCVFVMIWGGQYREEMNVTVFVVRFWWRPKERGTDTECYCDCCEVQGEGNRERN